MPRQDQQDTNGGRRSSVANSLRTVLHLVAAAHFWYGIYYDCTYVYFPSTHPFAKLPQFGGKLKYLTFLDMIVQAVFFTICVLNDFFGTNKVAAKNLPLIRRAKDYFFAAFAFPLAFQVGLIFWALMFVDRELVLPKQLDEILPSWLNHVMHTNIMFFIVIELLSTFRAYPARRIGVLSLVAFSAAYMVWLHVVKHYSGNWVYPVLEVLNLPLRIVFFAVTLVLSQSLYFAGEALNRLVWHKELALLKPVRGAAAARKSE